MVHGCDALKIHESSVAERTIKIRNEKTNGEKGVTHGGGVNQEQT
jgi:hypothetical protein